MLRRPKEPEQNAPTAKILHTCIPKHPPSPRSPIPRFGAEFALEKLNIPKAQTSYRDLTIPPDFRLSPFCRFVLKNNTQKTSERVETEQPRINGVS
jgi:hypothetical protein